MDNFILNVEHAVGFIDDYVLNIVNVTGNERDELKEIINNILKPYDDDCLIPPDHTMFHILESAEIGILQEALKKLFNCIKKQRRLVTTKEDLTDWILSHVGSSKVSNKEQDKSLDCSSKTITLVVASYNLGLGRSKPAEEASVSNIQANVILEEHLDLIGFQEHPANSDNSFRFATLLDMEIWKHVRMDDKMWFAWNSKTIEPCGDHNEYHVISSRIMAKDFLVKAQPGVLLRAYNLHLHSQQKDMDLSTHSLQDLNRHIEASLETGFICVLCGDFNLGSTCAAALLPAFPNLEFPTVLTSKASIIDVCRFADKNSNMTQDSPRVVWVPKMIDDLLTVICTYEHYTQALATFIATLKSLQTEVEDYVFYNVQQVEIVFESFKNQLNEAKATLVTSTIEAAFKVKKMLPIQRISSLWSTKTDFDIAWRQACGDHAMVVAQATFVANIVQSPQVSDIYYGLKMGVPSPQVVDLMNCIRGVGEASRYSWGVSPKVLMLLAERDVWLPFQILSVVGTRYPSYWDIVVVRPISNEGVRCTISAVEHNTKWKLAFHADWILEQESSRGQRLDHYADFTAKLKETLQPHQIREHMVHSYFQYESLEKAIHRLFEYDFLLQVSIDWHTPCTRSDKKDPLQILSESFAAIGIQSSMRNDRYPRPCRPKPMYIAM